MKRASQLVAKAISNDEVLRKTRAQQILHHWAEIVGPDLAKRSFPDRFTRGTVWVAVEGSAWAQELRMRREVILSRLDAFGGDSGLFTDIRFGVRPLPKEAAVSVIQEEPLSEPSYSQLSIREIANLRLAKMRSEP